MKKTFVLLILGGILVVFGCESNYDSNYTWTPYNIELISQRLLSCQTREEFEQEVRAINAELEREYQQQRMINAIKNSTYWQEKNAKNEWWNRNFFQSYSPRR